MDASEREFRIQQLEREIAAGRQRIAERQRQREGNPALEQDFLMAEAAETQRAAYVQRRADERGIVRMTTENALAPAPAANADWSQWEAWLAGHLADLRAEVADTVSRAIGIAIASTRKEGEAQFKAESADL